MKTKVLKYLIAIGLIISTARVGLAQELQAVGSGGAFHQNTQGSISWSLGEVATQTLKAGDYIITQGFQQSKLTLTSVYQRQGYNKLIIAYPNPTNDFINLKTDGHTQNLYYRVYDINGRIVKSGEFKSNPTLVSFRDLDAAIYFIRIIQNNLEVKTIRVVKN